MIHTMENPHTEHGGRRGAAQPGIRRGLMLGVAAMAAMAGGGVAWWRVQPHAPAGAPAARSEAVPAAGASGGEAEAAFWRLSLDTPDGAKLDMQRFKGKPLLVNFWATWCPPCVEELPLLDRFYREHAANGWQVVGLAIDQPTPVRQFLQKLPVSFPMAMAGLEGTELGRSLGNATGGLPFTVVMGSSGAVLHRKMGKVSEDDLKTWSTLR